MHKFVFEALLRPVWGFQETHPQGAALLGKTRVLLEKLHQTTNHDNLDEVLLNPTCSDAAPLWYVNHLRLGAGQLTQFWMSYVDMVGFLLKQFRA